MLVQAAWQQTDGEERDRGKRCVGVEVLPEDGQDVEVQVCCHVPRGLPVNPQVLAAGEQSGARGAVAGTVVSARTADAAAHNA